MLFRTRRDTPAQRKVLLSDPASILALLVFSFPSPPPTLHRTSSFSLSTEQERGPWTQQEQSINKQSVSVVARCVYVYLVDLRETVTTAPILNRPYSHHTYSYIYYLIQNTEGSVAFLAQTVSYKTRFYTFCCTHSSSCTEALEPAGQRMRCSISLAHVVTAHALSLTTPDRLVKRC